MKDIFGARPRSYAERQRDRLRGMEGPRTHNAQVRADAAYANAETRVALDGSTPMTDRLRITAPLGGGKTIIQHDPGDGDSVNMHQNASRQIVLWNNTTGKGFAVTRDGDVWSSAAMSPGISSADGHAAKRGDTLLRTENVVTSFYLASGSADSARAVASTNIKTNSIQTAHLQANSVGSTELKDNSVNTLQLAANAVGGAQLKDNSVNTLQLAGTSVGNAQIKDNAVNGRTADTTVLALRSWVNDQNYQNQAQVNDLIDNKINTHWNNGNHHSH